MLAILHDNFFSVGDGHEVWVAIRHMVWCEHYLLSDLNSNEYRSWKAAFSGYAAKFESYLAAGNNQLNNGGRGKTRIEVWSGTSNWTSSPPRLSISDALQYLYLPYRIFVENYHADIAFLRAFMSSKIKDEFDQLRLKGKIQIVHGGGLGTLTTQVQNEIEGKQPRRDLRSYVVFDNDGLKPKAPSNSSSRLSEYCCEKSVPHHQLRRRSIENYVHAGALSIWASAQGRNRGKVIHAISALAVLSEDQRDYFNMKDGISGDSRQADRDPYLNLSAHHKRKLSKGFGDKLSSVFMDDDFGRSVTEKDYVRACNEIQEVIAQIFAGI